MVALLDTPDSCTIPFPTSASAAAKRGAERRMFPRKELHIEVQGKRLDHSLPALRQPHLSLALRDVSLGGLSAISPTPLAPGERLSVSFPTSFVNGTPAWDASGRVIRCDVSGLGYRIAVEFDALPAAA